MVAVARVRKPDEAAIVPSIPQLFREEVDPTRTDFIPHEFGAGVGNRLNGYACYFAASGSYVDPVIS